MNMRKKFLYMLLVLVMFCAVSYGGCGGSSSGGGGSSDTPNSEEQKTPSESKPDNQDDSNAVYDINGKWHVESGAHYLNIPTLGKYVSPYVAGSVEDFEISVSENTSDDYYTLKLSGSDVTETEEEGALMPIEHMKSWTIEVKFKQDPAMSEEIMEEEIEAPISGNNHFSHPSANSYVFEWLASCNYKVVDNSTVIYRIDLPNTGGPDSNYAELTLKRVD